MGHLKFYVTTFKILFSLINTVYKTYTSYLHPPFKKLNLEITLYFSRQNLITFKIQKTVVISLYFFFNLLPYKIIFYYY